MNQAMVSVARNFMNLLYPLSCASCAKELEPLSVSTVCDFCKGQIRQNPKPYCRSCGRSVQSREERCAECRTTHFYFDRAYSACLYEGVLKKLVHLFKYKGKVALSGILSKLMIDFAKENREIVEAADVITFVPLKEPWLKSRDFNHAKVLALKIAKEFVIAFSDTLEKTASTRRQNELSRDERLVNMKGAFGIKKGVNLEGLRILLIDDVMTTGATLNECSCALLEGGAKEVSCFTLARGI